MAAQPATGPARVPGPRQSGRGLEPVRAGRRRRRTTVSSHKKVALITGAARGIGAAIARRFAEDGCLVVIGDIDAAGAQECADQLRPRAVGVQMDVRDGDSVRAAVRAIVREHEGIDILVNNAGVLCAGPFDAVSEAEWNRLIGVNITGLFQCIQAVVPVMRERAQAAIINIASISAERGGGVFGNVWYAATKAATIAITKGLGRELGPLGIRVNAISPGLVDTDMVHELLTPAARASVLRRVPLGRFASTDDIARCAVFLASEEASYITGETVLVDGGFVRT